MEMKKYYFIIIILLLVFLGCKHDSPSKSLVKEKITSYLKSINLPLDIKGINISFGKYAGGSSFYPVEINVKGKIYSDDREKLLFNFNNTYDSKFSHLLYGYWLAEFSLRRFPPSDSIIYFLGSKNLGITPNNIRILKIDSLNDKEKFYPVTLSVKNKKPSKEYTLPFSQDEFGIWKIGISDLITPGKTVRSFLSDVNKGLTSKARRYFTYQYKFGYDEIDKKDLENLFPAGSIKDVQITDVNTDLDTSRVNLTVIKTDSDTFKTNLELVKLGFEWRIKYLGVGWKFKSNEFQQE
jgi:hypothetical protein